MSSSVELFQRWLGLEYVMLELIQGAMLRSRKVPKTVRGSLTAPEVSSMAKKIPDFSLTQKLYLKERGNFLNQENYIRNAQHG